MKTTFLSLILLSGCAGIQLNNRLKNEPYINEMSLSAQNFGDFNSNKETKIVTIINPTSNTVEVDVFCQSKFKEFDRFVFLKPKQEEQFTIRTTSMDFTGNLCSIAHWVIIQ